MYYLPYVTVPAHMTSVVLSPASNLVPRTFESDYEFSLQITGLSTFICENPNINTLPEVAGFLRALRNSHWES